MGSEEKKWDAFISYSYQDREEVRPIVDRLKEKGFRVFLDSEDISLGSSLQVALERGLYNSRALIVFLSKQGIESSWVQKEYEIFLSLHGKDQPVIPVILDDTPTNTLPPILRDKLVLRWKNTEDNLHALSKALDLTTEQLQARQRDSGTRRPDIVMKDKEGNTVVVEIKLSKDYKSFSVEQQEKFLQSLAKLLDTNIEDITIKDKREGSITYEFSFTPEQAARLFYLINQGGIDELREFNVKEVRRLNRSNRVFIGHGRSPAWRELKDFLQDRLRLPWDEFNREPTAGYTTTERLDQMLSEAGFAFLIMTGEDLHDDNELHARENVIHEIGLFQGKLGRTKAIVLLEDGCTEFSNITGLTQIRFPRNNIASSFEELRRVLEREGIIS